MRSSRERQWLVTSLSFGRFVGSLAFACLAFQAPVGFLSWLYAATAMTDLVDGALSRRLQVASYPGRVIDLIGDKALTATSLLYAAARGIDLLPLAAIAARDVLVLGARLIVVAGTPLLSTSRWFGAFLASCVWGATFVLIRLSDSSPIIGWVKSAYWIAGAFAGGNLAIRLYRARVRIRSSVEDAPRADREARKP
jgi:phosphatidylglycerophosphate synthase